MGRIPEDPDERLAWLERWGAEQNKRLGVRDPPPAGLLQRIGRKLEWQVERLDPLFDRGLNTSSDVYFPTSETEGLIYVAGPTAWDILPRALRKVGASDNDVFVEFGCGKGRVVHQAARWPLKRVIGVEIIPEIADFARSLVVAQQGKYRCQSVEIMTCDAARFPVPDDLTIAYFAYGSDDATMDAVLHNLIDSIDRSPRRVRFIYYWPTRGITQVLATGRFRLLPDLSFRHTRIFESCG